jgi:hypothetical protein
VKAIREQWRQRFSDDYGNVLGEELAKLDLLEGALLAKALSGGPDGGVDLRAVDRLLAIWDRRVRMLGLDLPEPGRADCAAGVGREGDRRRLLRAGGRYRTGAAAPRREAARA